MSTEDVTQQARGRPRGTVAAAVRHARRFGTEMVLESVAQQTRDPLELAEAVRELRAIDPKLRLPKSSAVALAHWLVAEGYGEQAACRTVGIDRRSLRAHPRPPIREWHSDGSSWPPPKVPAHVLEVPKSAPDAALQRGVRVQNERGKVIAFPPPLCTEGDTPEAA